MILERPRELDLRELHDLRELRHRAGLSQTDLAVRTRIPQSHLSAIEAGKRKAGPARARRIAVALAEALGVDVDDVSEVFS